LSKLAFKAYANAVNNTDISEEDRDLMKKQISDIKNKTIQMVESIAIDPTLNKTIFGNEYFSTQIIKSDNGDSAIKEALDNNLSIVNSTECLKKLRKYYNLSQDEQLAVIKTDSDPSLDIGNNNNTSTKVKIGIIDLETKQKLNYSICDTTISVEIPLKDNQVVNSTRYNEYKKDGIDIYNSTDPFFNSKCYSYSMNGYDTTLNMRRNNIYSNTSITCNQGCEYNGLNANNYVLCVCDPSTTSDHSVSNNFLQVVFESVSDINFDLVQCSNRVFNVTYN
jgi:hypothetical protein